MSEETQETQETNEVSTPEDLEAVRAELEEEKKAKAAADQALSDVSARLAEKDDRIAALEAELSEAKTGSEAAAAELTQVKEAHVQAVAKYLDAARLANPAIPQDNIAEIRARGLWIGVEIAKSSGSARPYCEALMELGILAKETHEQVVRIAPPLVITKDEIDWALPRLAEVLSVNRA